MAVVALRSYEERSAPAEGESTYWGLAADWVRLRCRAVLAGAKEPSPETERLERQVREQRPEPMTWLATSLGLSEREVDVLVVLVAAQRCPELLESWAALHGQQHLRYPSPQSLRRLLGEDALGFGRAGPLHRFRLVHEEELGAAEPSLLRIDPFLVAYLSGLPEWDDRIAERLETIAEVPALESWRIDAWLARIRSRLSRGPVRVLVSGAAGSGRRSFCQALATRLGARALVVDTRGLSDEEFAEAQLRAERQALLLGHALVWTADSLKRRARAGGPLAPLQFVVVSAGEAAPHIGDELVELELPTSEERRELWARLVPESQAWGASDRRRLEDYRVQVGDIAAVVDAGAGTFAEVSALCRRVTRGKLDEFAEVLECPFTRDDLVLAATTREILDDFVHEARARARFWERESARRLFPRGRGLVGLLAGSPGTGKTMSAQVIAAELGLDLVRIDLATVVSKYIGETAKNLSRVFRVAREMNAVLFFDEADALFSRRTEVKDSHDRYANADTNYLLQHLEDFDGIALLATNKKANIDAAFLRRLRFVLEFERPTPQERVALYRATLEQLGGALDRELVDRGIPALAESFDVTGAQIKLAVLAAVFRAEREGSVVKTAHVLTGLERELAKEGRPLSRSDRERALTRLGGAR